MPSSPHYLLLAAVPLLTHFSMPHTTISTQSPILTHNTLSVCDPAPFLQPRGRAPQPLSSQLRRWWYESYDDVVLEPAPRPFPKPSHLAGQSPPSMARFYNESDRIHDIGGTRPSSPAAAPMTLPNSPTAPIVRINLPRVHVQRPRPVRGALHRQLPPPRQPLPGSLAPSSRRRSTRSVRL